ncbi:hypothetical protein [Cystobacter ferrugineus]|uniref:hypothetical protein n=1 Tax=Cystobacter ferrugineus TaxID=83449 RepID=UPI001FE72773|nr:hypothetical protein [Cystobacter ferrugineus]
MTFVQGSTSCWPRSTSESANPALTLNVFIDEDSEFGPSEGAHVISAPRHVGVLAPMVHAIPVQLLAYHAALAHGTDVDKPRNLAKSVTVE